MKKTTPLDLTNRLTKYSALSLAIVGLADANGQIVYTDLGAGGVTPAFDTEYLLNLNNDDPNGPALGVHEFGLKAWANGSGGSQLMLYVPPTNAAIGVVGSAYSGLYPFALSSGAVISSGNANWQSASGGWQSLAWNSTSLPVCNFSSNWCDTSEKFLGLKFQLETGTEIYFGWARVKINTANTPGDFTILDYAYNATDTDDNGIGDPINAGQITLGIDDNDLASRVKVVALNKSIALYNLPEATNYKLFSMTGQEVLKGQSNGSTSVIEAKTLASGVYIVEIADADSSAVLRKKIVL